MDEGDGADNATETSSDAAASDAASDAADSERRWVAVARAVDDTTRGALVHFTEASAQNNLTTTTPWIAYISCDLNETLASMENDIFTLARDRGAVSALLYSTTSEACLLNAEYIENFDHVLTVFATTSMATSQLLDSQFRNTNDSFSTYNATLLNSSAVDVNKTLIAHQASDYLPHKSFLVAELTARNGTPQATVPSDGHNEPSSGGGAAAAKHKSNSAMIAVYVIAGFLAAMVLMTILSVVRRSRRNRRRRGAYIPGGAQPNAGIASAIVDSFPIVKFSKEGDGKEGYSNEGYSKGDIALDDLTPPTRASMSNTLDSGTASGSGSQRTSLDALEEDQCPICLVDFETGDDLRVLPCQGQHRFHQACVDPWLLRVSTSCPLCRKGGWGERCS